MPRYAIALATVFVTGSVACAQTPSYSKDIRPFLVKYCLECHNAKTMRGSLSLETHKAFLEGSDNGPVVVAGQPDKSKLVLQTEGKQKPTMPPAKAKFHPTKDEVKLLRAWVMAGAKDDGANIKVVLPTIKPKVDVLAPVVAVAYVPKTKEVLIARRDRLSVVDLVNGSAKFWQPAGGVGVKPMSGVSITALATTRSGNYVVGTDKGHMEIPIFLPGVRDTLLGEHKNSILDLAYDRDGQLIASAGYDSKIIVAPGWNWPSGPPPHLTELKEHSDAVYGLAFNPDGKLLASVSADRAMKVFDVEKGKLLYTLGHATDWLYAVAWSPDGKYLVSGGVDKSIRVYEALTPNPSPKGRGEWSDGAKLRQSVFAHEGAVLKLVFSSDSRTLYSVGEDRVVKAWDIEKMVERKVYAKQPETVLCLALREDAGQIIVGRYDGIVQLIDMKTGKVAHEFGAKPRDKRSVSRGSNPQEAPPPSPGISTATARKIALPAKLDATLERAGAVHFYRFDVKAGQPLGMRVIRTDSKAKFEPVLVLGDMAGRVLAESNDGHLGYTFAAAGTYAIGVRDRDYRGGAGFKYKLELGEIPVVTSIFPLGIARGSEADVFVEGVFLDKASVRVKVPADAKLGSKIAVPVTSKYGTPLGRTDVIVGEFPDILPDILHLREKPKSIGSIPIPATANGSLVFPQSADVWGFKARKGQRLIVEVNARRLGSRLDSILEILDANDQPVPRAVLRSQAKTNVTFRDHDSNQGNIRIEAWSELGTNDFLFVGNELVKIKELPTHPDADCNFFAAGGRRLGYLDTTPTHHANGTPMYKVSIHPPGTMFPPNGYPVFTLYYKNDDGGPSYGRDSRIVFDPPADGAYKVRIADARGMGGVNFGYRLTVRQPREHFTLKATPKSPTVARGSAIPITITAERIDGFDGAIKVEIKNLPAGFHLPATTIEAGTFSTTAALYADADAKLPAKLPVLKLVGRSDAEIPFVFVDDFDMPKLIGPGDLVTTTQESEVSIKPGAPTKLLVRIERHNGFKGRVPLEVRGLPHGVRVLDIGLNGILVNENESTRTIVIYAEPWVHAQEHPFVVLARREGKGTEHAAKSVLLKVK